MKKLLLVALVLGGLSLVPSMEAGRCRKNSCKRECAPRCEKRCKPQQCETRVVGQNFYPCCRKEVITIPGYRCCDVIETCCKREHCGPVCAPLYEGDEGYDVAKQNQADKGTNDSMMSSAM